MWLLAVTVAAAVLVVVVTRGSWTRLAQLPIRGSGFFLSGMIIQVALGIVDLAPRHFDGLGFGLLMLSYALLLAFCLINIRLRGMTVIALGIALNTLVIGLNQGMPTRTVGIDERGDRVEQTFERTVKHRPASGDDLLGFLGDEILPPKPFDALISIGDIVIGLGICTLAFFGSRRARSRGSRQTGTSARRSRARSSTARTRPSYT